MARKCWFCHLSVLAAFVMAASLNYAAPPTSRQEHASHTITADLWWDLDRVPDAVLALPELARPKAGRVLKLDVAAMSAALQRVPASTIDEKGAMLVGILVDQSDAVLELPTPEGGVERFRIVESPVLPADLQAKFPSIRTFIGQGIDRPAATVHFDLTPLGFHAQVLGPVPNRGIDRVKTAAIANYAIDPVSRGDREHHVSYAFSDLPDPGPFSCTTTGDGPVVNQRASPRGPGAVPLRVLRMAMAATGEYTAFHSAPLPPNQTAGIAAIATVINRMNQIFMRDLAVQFILATNNDAIVFTNAATDPFTPPAGSPPGTVPVLSDLLAQNPGVVAAAIAAGEYDLGHAVHALPPIPPSGSSPGCTSCFSGQAAIGAVCGPNARNAASTSMLPNGTYFWITLVAHEVGHQIGATHTFNGVFGTCGNANQYTASSAIEPGSGTTIMSYAGNCSDSLGNDNVVSHSPFPTSGLPEGGTLPMFGAYTIDQVGQTLASVACGFFVTTGNNRPFSPIISPSSWTIPANTPFRLNASAGDPDLGQQVTLSWEQFNIGAQRALGPDTGANEPLFRTFLPSDSTDRSFPTLATTLGSPPLLGENLPRFDRTMFFRAVSRDNFAQGGGTRQSQATVTVFRTPGDLPFRVTAPVGGSGSSGLCAGQVLTVEWNTVNSQNPPINAASVDITLSLDGGQTWPIALAAGVPNSGQAIVSVPAISTAQGRIKVEPTNNIFFAVNPGNMIIASGPPSISVEPADIATCQQFSPRSLAFTPGANLANVQWYKNGAAISGATSTALTFPSLTRSDTGDYHAELTNACGTARTRTARIQVGVSFDSEPSDLDIAPCSPVILAVQARGVGSLSYQWYRNSEPVANTGRVSGANSPTLAISGIRYDDEGDYSCRVTDSCETRETRAAKVVLTTPVWQEVPMSSAPAIGGSAEYWTAAYDEHRRVFVLYGGLTQTGQNSNALWEYDGYTWTVRQTGFPFVTTTNGQPLFDNAWPPKPQASAMVYNPDDHKVYLIAPFGSSYPLAICTWDGTSWSRPYYGPVSGETARTHAVFDRVNHRIVMVRSVGGSHNSELLIYDPATNAMTGPIAMQPQVQNGAHDSSLWYDERRSAVYWYNNINDFVFPTMWRLNADNTWSQLSGNPPRLKYASQVEYDPVRFQATTMGGIWDGASYYTGTVAWPGLTIRPWTINTPPASDWAGILPDGPPRNPAGAGISPPNDWSPVFWDGLAFDRHRRTMVATGRSLLPTPFVYSWHTYERRYRDEIVFDKPATSEVLAPGNIVRFNAYAAGHPTLTYQWRRNGTVVTNGPSPSGGTFSGAQSANLTLTNVGPADQGNYTLLASNACGSAISSAVVLGCTADFNHTDGLTVQDIFDYLNAWFNNDPSSDFNGTGGVSVQDVFDYLNAWFEGC